MNVLLVGAGGREHALAWKIAQSPRLTRLFVAPGNAGTDTIKRGDAATPGLVENVAIQATDTPALVAFARANHIDLVIVGPEGPLATGLADALRAAGLRVFGPSAAAAEIEASKAFSKAFMARQGYPRRATRPLTKLSRPAITCARPGSRWSLRPLGWQRARA